MRSLGKALFLGLSLQIPFAETLLTDKDKNCSLLSVRKIELSEEFPDVLTAVTALIDYRCTKPATLYFSVSQAISKENLRTKGETRIKLSGAGTASLNLLVSDVKKYGVMTEFFAGDVKKSTRLAGGYYSMPSNTVRFRYIPASSFQAKAIQTNQIVEGFEPVSVTTGTVSREGRQEIDLNALVQGLKNNQDINENDLFVWLAE